jgi:hypothetical protein
MPLGESEMVPTTMLFRNLMSTAVEETIRANPLDGVVLQADRSADFDFLVGASGDPVRRDEH